MSTRKFRSNLGSLESCINVVIRCRFGFGKGFYATSGRRYFQSGRGGRYLRRSMVMYSMYGTLLSKLATRAEASHPQQKWTEINDKVAARSFQLIGACQLLTGRRYGDRRFIKWARFCRDSQLA